MNKMLLLVPLLLTASCSAVDATAPVRDAKAEARLDQLLAGKVAGPTRSCITHRDADRQEVIDERTIIYRVGRDLLYRNDISPSCAGLDRDSTLIRRSSSPSLCRGDIFQVRDSGTSFERGSCSLGEFTEYRTLR